MGHQQDDLFLASHETPIFCHPSDRIPFFGCCRAFRLCHIPSVNWPFFKREEVRRANDITGKPFSKPGFIFKAVMKYLYRLAAPYLKNWRTSLMGVPLLLGGVASLVSSLADVAGGGSPTLEAWQAGVASILAGWAAIMAKDAPVTGVPK